VKVNGGFMILQNRYVPAASSIRASLPLSDHGMIANMQLTSFISWLNPRGVRDGHLLKSIKTWQVEIEAGMKRRRVMMGLDKSMEEDEGVRRRVTRRGGEEEGFLGWKVCPFSWPDGLSRMT
jgi:hypothetical protein